MNSTPSIIYIQLYKKNKTNSNQEVNGKIINILKGGGKYYIIRDIIKRKMGGKFEAEV